MDTSLNGRAGRRRARRRRLLRTTGVPLLLAALVVASAPGWQSYTIKRGDTLTDIAHRYHTTVAQLVEVNDLQGRADLIYAGDRLQVPSPRAPAGRTVDVRHRVVRGDTLIGIARKYGVTTKAVAERNKLRAPYVVRLGETLLVPVPKPKAEASTTRRYPPEVTRAADRNRARLAHSKQPSRTKTRDLIVRTARKFDVDPALALAVSWQESGWNQRRVSPANAIGAMQVIPSTGRWISGTVGRDLDLLDVEDNIVAGVVLLRILTRAAPLEDAVAGYYQGLRSVRENGMYPDTKRYVRNVLALRKEFRA